MSVAVDEKVVSIGWEDEPSCLKSEVTVTIPSGHFGSPAPPAASHADGAPRKRSSERRRLPLNPMRLSSGRGEIKLSREELAQITGTTLFTVSRLLSKWEEQGWVVRRRSAVLVRDPLRLMELGDEEKGRYRLCPVAS
jgi:hypothetical protein